MNCTTRKIKLDGVSLVLLLILSNLLLMVPPVAADKGSFTGPGSSKIRMPTTSVIQILDEQIDIRIHKEYIELDIRSRFHNQSGKYQKIAMGFPEQSGKLLDRLNSFGVDVDGKQLAVKLQDLKDHSEAGKKERESWYSFAVDFKPGQVREVRKRYWVYATEYRGLRSFSYLMNSAAHMKSPIGLVQIKATLDNGLVFAGKRLATHDISIQPDGFSMSRSKKVLFWRFKNLDPLASHAIEIFYEQDGMPFMALADEASSVHKPVDDDTFDAENLFDDDLTTAWAPAASGIEAKGTWFRFVLGEGSPHTLKRIGVIPGRSPDYRFMACSRVRKAHLLFPDGVKHPLVFEDIPRIQYVTIPPQKITEFKFVIDEVAEGLLPTSCGTTAPFVAELKVFTE